MASQKASAQYTEPHPDYGPESLPENPIEGNVSFLNTGTNIRADVIDHCLEVLSLQKNVTLSDFIANVEKIILLKALSKFNGNLKDTARFLGLKYTTLHQKMKKYHISFRKLSIAN